MARIVRAPSARLDLYEIWEYVARESEARARSLVDAFDEHFALLAEHPRMGRARPELGPDLRSFPSGRYVIYYRPFDGEEQGIEVVRVARAERDADALF